MIELIITAIQLAIGFSIVGLMKGYDILVDLYWSTYANIWDCQLHLANQFAHPLNPKAVIPAGKPGYMGKE